MLSMQSSTILRYVEGTVQQSFGEAPVQTRRVFDCLRAIKVAEDKMDSPKTQFRPSLLRWRILTEVPEFGSIFGALFL